MQLLPGEHLLDSESNGDGTKTVEIETVEGFKDRRVVPEDEVIEEVPVCSHCEKRPPDKAFSSDGQLLCESCAEHLYFRACEVYYNASPNAR